MSGGSPLYPALSWDQHKDTPSSLLADSVQSTTTVCFTLKLLPQNIEKGYNYVEQDGPWTAQFTIGCILVEQEAQTRFRIDKVKPRMDFENEWISIKID